MHLVDTPGVVGRTIEFECVSDGDLVPRFADHRPVRIWFCLEDAEPQRRIRDQDLEGGTSGGQIGDEGHHFIHMLDI